MVQGIKNIRFKVFNKGNKEIYEILKLALSTNKQDFYFFGKHKSIKVSFHKDGTKYLRITHKGKTNEITLFKDEHYSNEGLNPIFSYFPKEINSYPIKNMEENKLRTMNVLLKPNKPDIMLNVFWVNLNKSDQFLLPQNSYKEIKNLQVFYKDGATKKTSFKIPTAIDFGQQKLFFDWVDVNRDPIDNEYEVLRIYKPGIQNCLQINSIAQVQTYFSDVNEQGCSLVGSPEDDYYTLVF